MSSLSARCSYVRADGLFHFYLLIHSCYKPCQFLIVRPLENAPSNSDLAGDLNYTCSVHTEHFLSSSVLLDRKQQESQTHASCQTKPKAGRRWKCKY